MGINYCMHGILKTIPASNLRGHLAKCRHVHVNDLKGPYKIIKRLLIIIKNKFYMRSTPGCDQNEGIAIAEAGIT